MVYTPVLRDGDLWFQLEVEMWAFAWAGTPWRIRVVDLPADEFPDGMEGALVTRLLERVFYFGQNDFQPRAERSVSVGDVVRFFSRRFVVMPAGFREVPDGWKPPTDVEGRLLPESIWFEDPQAALARVIYGRGTTLSYEQWTLEVCDGLADLGLMPERDPVRGFKYPWAQRYRDGWAPDAVVRDIAFVVQSIERSGTGPDKV